MNVNTVKSNWIKAWNEHATQCETETGTRPMRLDECGYDSSYLKARLVATYENIGTSMRIGGRMDLHVAQAWDYMAALAHVVSGEVLDATYRRALLARNKALNS